ncbi:MAG: hypothetical protein LBL58_04655 [Tannerellaceae bacterium]|jgi:hypothetical protein|nr:hypothetical protein [Tannerellaceae bacterium]
MKTWSTYIILAAFALAGCSDEMPDSPVIPPSNLPGEEGSVVLTIRFPNSGGPNTYSIGGFEENKITRLDILSFTKGTSSFLTDILEYHIPIEQPDTITGFNIDPSGITKKVKTKLQNMVDSQRLVVIANLPSPVDFTTLHKGKTMKEIVDLLQFSGATWRPPLPVGKTDTTSFPMFGQMTKFEKIHSVTDNPVPTEITFQMIRSVAKVDVGVDLKNGTGDPALGFGSVFKIKKVHVYNASDRGYIAPHDDYLVSPKNIQGVDSAKIEKVNLVSATRAPAFTYDFPDPGRRLGNPIYIPESDVPNGTYTPAYLVIEAEYYGAKYYYRIDFTNGGEYVPILRNHNYEINITGVRTPGYTSQAEAAAAPISRFGQLILDDIGLKEVISYNNEYYLGVSSTNLYVDWMGQEVSVAARTSYPGGWTASDPSWGNYWGNNTPSAPTALDYVEFDILDNLTGVPREYTFNIKAGMLTQKITVTQGAGSNSYITKPGTPITIPITSAKKANGTPYTGGYASIGYLWYTNSSLLGSLVTAANTFTVTPTAETGNIIVAMRDAQSKILYSWHIWVTDYNPEDPTKQNSNNGFIVMDRNLGAGNNQDDVPSYGSYYQWGRKDPFFVSGSDAGVNEFVTEPIKPYMNYADSAIQHPTTFYAVSSSPYDWIGPSQNNSMWRTIEGEKGPSDPCPFGWRVPDFAYQLDSPWSDFPDYNGAIYPLGGYLDAFSGIRQEAGSKGGVWAAFALGYNAYSFSFTASSRQHSGLFRAYGYPVRCVKDTR